MPEAVRKPRRSICASKILLDLVNQKPKNAGDGYRKKPIEKTFLRLLGSHTFSHSLDPMPSSTAEIHSSFRGVPNTLPH